MWYCVHLSHYINIITYTSMYMCLTLQCIGCCNVYSIIMWMILILLLILNIHTDVLVSDISLICVYGIYIYTGIWLSYTMSYHDYT